MSHIVKPATPPIETEIISESQPPTPDEILAHGDVRVRIAVTKVVGLAIVTLTIGGIFAWFKDPQNSKELWVIIGPIISGAILSAIGFLAGERHGSSRKQHR